MGVPVVKGEQNLPPPLLVRIGLTDLPNQGKTAVLAVLLVTAHLKIIDQAMWA